MAPAEDGRQLKGKCRGPPRAIAGLSRISPGRKIQRNAGKVIQTVACAALALPPNETSCSDYFACSITFKIQGCCQGLLCGNVAENTDAKSSTPLAARKARRSPHSSRAGT